MTFNRHELKHQLTISEKLPCSFPGCSTHRYHLSIYCNKHFSRQQYWGSAFAERLGSRYFKPFDARVAELISLNRTHPAVTVAVAFLDRWLEESGRGLRSLAGPAGKRITELGRALYDQRRSPEQVLIRAGGVWLAATEEDYILTVQHQDCQTGFRINNLLRKSLKGRNRGNDRGRSALGFTVTPPYHRDLGRYIRAGLSNCLVNIAFSTKLKKLEDAKTAAAVRSPMTLFYENTNH
jgi:hypothetical protein